MFNKKHGQKGFTLIELMIVVVIVGILAALAIPRFMRTTTKSKQSEAKTMLKQIYVMQQAYRQEKNTYFLPTVVAGSATPNAFVTIGVEIGPTARYSYTMVAGSITFTCTAAALGAELDDDAIVDTWTMTETGSLVCTIDDAILP